MASADFRRAYAGGSRARGSFLTVVVHPNGEAGPRMGLSVGKRCWKSAVKRNRVRRVFREAFRLSREELPTGFDYVLIASTPRLAPHMPAVRAELLHLARKALRRHREKLERGKAEKERA